MRAGLLIGKATEVVPHDKFEYSSTLLGHAKGHGFGQGMLDSDLAWCSLTLDLNQWIQMDAGQSKVIDGVVTQGRRDYPQWATSYFIQVSIDGVTWHAGESYSNLFNGNTDRDTKVIVAFTNPPTARYVRIFPRTWMMAHQCMRAGLLIGQATEVVPHDRFEYSSTLEGDAKGYRYGQGMLDSPLAWCSASADLNQWIQMDAGQLKVIDGVVTQGRRDSYPDATWWVTSYFVQVSIDGVTWHARSSYSTTCVDSGPWSWGGSSVVCGRFVALVLQDPAKFASGSTRNLAPVGSTPLPSYNAAGGPQGNGHVTFEANKKQYLEMGVRTLQIASNGGLTIVAVVRFNRFGSYWEKILFMGDGLGEGLAKDWPYEKMSMDNIVLGRDSNTNSLSFKVSY